MVLLDCREHSVEVLGEVRGVEIAAVQRLVELLGVRGDVLATRTRPVGQHVIVVRDFEAGVDRSFLYCERLVAGRRRVEPDVEDGLVEAGVDGAERLRGTR